MLKQIKKLIKIKKLPIILGAILALVVAVFLIGAVVSSFSGGSAIKVVSAQSVFQSSENPQFIFVYKKQANIFNRFFASVVDLFGSENKEITTTIKIFNTNGDEIDGLNPQIKKESSGKFAVDLDHSQFQQELRPGKYKIKFEVKDGDKTYTQEQDFRWGVLAINTNKSIYLPGEEAYLQFAVLNDGGRTICDARIELQIQNSNSKIQTLSTENGEIKYSEDCKGDNLTEVPDYFAYYKVNGAGKYRMKLTNLDNGYEITDYFEVRESVAFDVERIGPTRIYPPAKYEMKIKIKANQDFDGEIIETVPMTFAVEAKPKAEQNSFGESYIKMITWQAEIKKGETKEFTYIFDAPEVSPYFYLIGPLRIGDWQESRQWQIAADALDAGIIIAWPYATAVPVGWVEEPDLVGFYTMGVTASPSSGAGLGQATHTHAEASSNHTHTTYAHTHTGSATTGTANGSATTYGGVGSGLAAHQHTHAITIAANSSVANIASSSDIDTTSNDPPYTNVVFIKSNGTPTGIPDSAWAFSATVPTGWARASTLKFLKGVTTGGGGGTGGSSNSHTHLDNAGAGHRHTESAHSHTLSGWTVSAETRSGTTSGASAIAAHSHTLSNETAIATEGYGVATYSNADAQPQFRYEEIVQNNTGGQDFPNGIIAIWISNAAPPAGWVLCDGTNGTPDMNQYFLKGADGATGVAGVTGGSSSGHTHASAASHSHLTNNHTHTPTLADNTGSSNYKNTGSASPVTHTHTLSFSAGTLNSTSTAAPTLAANSGTTHYPPYKQVQFIMKLSTTTISGTCTDPDQVTACKNGQTVKIAVNGVLDNVNTGTTSGGSWTISRSPQLSADDNVVAFIDNPTNTASRAVAFANENETGGIAGMLLYESHITIGSNDNITASNSDLATYDNSSGDADLFFDVGASNNLQMCANSDCVGFELYVKSGNKYAPGSASATYAEIHDIEIDGTFDMTGTGNYASISGSWNNDATFTVGTSTIFFIASDSTELVSQSADGTYAFNNVQFGDSATTAYTGHFDLNGNITALDVNGNLTVDAGTLHVDTKNVTLGGSLSIGTNGVYTTSTGTFTFDNTTAPVNWVDSNSTKSNMGAVTINGTTKHVDLGSSVKATTVTVADSQTLDANGANTITLSGANTPLTVTGVFTCSTGTVTYEGTAVTTVAGLNGASHYYNLTVGLGSDTNTFSFTAAGEIEASGSISLIPGSSGVHTFDMGSNNLSVGGGAGNTGGIAVPAGTVFTQSGGTTKVNSSNGGTATIGGTGTTKFYVFQIGNASDGATYTFNLGGDIGASSSFTLAAGTHTLGLSSYEFGVWGDWTMNSGASLSAQTGTINLGNTTSMTLTCSTNCEPYNLTLNKTSGTDSLDNVTLGANLIIRNTLTITDGQLIQGNYDVRVEGSTAVVIVSGIDKEWTNIGTGDLTLGGTFANLGSVSFDTGDGGCTDVADEILIRSTTTGTARAWSGGGTFNMRNLNVQDQNASGITITVYDGTDAGNTPNWVFAFCGTPTPGGGPSPLRINGGVIIKGGTRIK